MRYWIINVLGSCPGLARMKQSTLITNGCAETHLKDSVQRKVHVGFIKKNSRILSWLIWVIEVEKHPEIGWKSPTYFSALDCIRLVRDAKLPLIDLRYTPHWAEITLDRDRQRGFKLDKYFPPDLTDRAAFCFLSRAEVTRSEGCLPPGRSSSRHGGGSLLMSEQGLVFSLDSASWS